MRNDKGFALILTLVITALIVALAAELMHQVYVDTSISRNFRDGQQASLLAESGIIGGKRLLEIALAGRSYSSISDVWAKPFKLDDETGAIEITVVEEDGKINLNGLVLTGGGVFEPNTRKMLRRLGTLIDHPVPDNAWDNLAAWLDVKTPSVFSSADTLYYMTLKPPYKPRKGKLMTMGELSLVKGFTQEMVADLRPLVTIYSAPTAAGYSVININTAPTKVLAALDPQISTSMVDRIDKERRNGTFTSLGTLSTVPGLDTIANGMPGMIGVKGTTYRITS
ncbi:MAG: type II secretion system minor pseudopilin GspK, partial [Deltaproteobacteria bacterium]